MQHVITVEGRSLIRTFLASATKRCRNQFSEWRASSEQKEVNRFGSFKKNDYL